MNTDSILDTKILTWWIVNASAVVIESRGKFAVYFGSQPDTAWCDTPREALVEAMQKKPFRMKCELCGRGLPQGAHLHRQNEKGPLGIWRCERCNTLPIDPEVQAICDALGSGQ